MYSLLSLINSSQVIRPIDCTSSRVFECDTLRVDFVIYSPIQYVNGYFNISLHN